MSFTSKTKIMRFNVKNVLISRNINQNQRFVIHITPLLSCIVKSTSYINEMKVLVT